MVEEKQIGVRRQNVGCDRADRIGKRRERDEGGGGKLWWGKGIHVEAGGRGRERRRDITLRKAAMATSRGRGIEKGKRRKRMRKEERQVRRACCHKKKSLSHWGKDGHELAIVKLWREEDDDTKTMAADEWDQLSTRASEREEREANR